MIPDLIIQNTTGNFAFLQGSILIVLSLALILMIVDAILEAKSQSKFKAELNSKRK